MMFSPGRCGRSRVGRRSITVRAYDKLVWSGIAVICPGVITLRPSWRATTRAGSDRFRAMPTLFRFIVIGATLAGVAYWGLFVLATRFEPAPKEVVQPIGNLKIRTK